MEFFRVAWRLGAGGALGRFILTPFLPHPNLRLGKKKGLNPSNSFSPWPLLKKGPVPAQQEATKGFWVYVGARSTKLRLAWFITKFSSLARIQDAFSSISLQHGAGNVNTTILFGNYIL